MKALVMCLALAVIFLAVPATVWAQDHGGGGGTAAVTSSATSWRSSGMP